MALAQDPATSSYLSNTGVSVDPAGSTLCGWVSLTATTSFQHFCETRNGGGNVGRIEFDNASGNLNIRGGANVATIVAAPSVGTWFFWYINYSGTGAGQTEGGIWPYGGSLSTATIQAGSASLITTIRWGGQSGGPQDHIGAALKVFSSSLSAGQLQAERDTYMPRIPAYLALPAFASTVAACALDASGNGRDFTVNGSPAVVAGPPIANGLELPPRPSLSPYLHNLTR